MNTPSPPRFPVLLLHGIDDTHVIFDPLVAYLRDRGWTDIHAIDLSPNDGAAGLEPLATQVQDYVNGPLQNAEKIDIVGFSMGGIVGRYYLQRLGGLSQVRRFVTLSSPHNGTWLAYLRANRGAEQMRPQSAFLQDLNSTVEELQRVAFTSIWTPYDLVILPTRSSQVEVGTMKQLPVLAHPLMVRDGRSLAAIADALTCDPEPPPTQPTSLADSQNS